MDAFVVCVTPGFAFVTVNFSSAFGSFVASRTVSEDIGVASGALRASASADFVVSVTSGSAFVAVGVSSAFSSFVALLAVLEDVGVTSGALRPTASTVSSSAVVDAFVVSVTPGFAFVTVGVSSAFASFVSYA